MKRTPPSMQTQRLVIRPVALSDLEKVHALHSLPETDRFNTLGIPETIAETEQIITNWITGKYLQGLPHYIFAIEEKESADFIGLIALKTGNPKLKIGEVWYKLHVNFWGKGFATEALQRVLAFGFQQLQFHRIEAGCAVENKGSIRVLEKVGMQREGRKRKVLPLKTGWSDNFEFAILEEDFNNLSGTDAP